MTGHDNHGTQEPVDLTAGAGPGPVWGMAGNDLNATVLAWPAGHEVIEHVNAELDVFVVVLEGEGVFTIDAEPHALRAGQAILIERGCARSIRAGTGGLRYLSIHRRRGPLQIDT
jgi:quercetin dioxygenase-like cupin family protein